jgi:excisionase family DNA binding protein
MTLTTDSDGSPRPDDWMSLAEAAEFLGVSRHTLYRRVEDGALLGYQRGVDRRMLLKRADVEALGVPQPIDREAAAS